MEVLMFSPDDLTPALVALPYVTYTTKSLVKSSIGSRLLASRAYYCRWLPWFCVRY